MKANKYDLRGVSSQKEEVHKAIVNLDKGLYPMAFCKVLPDYAGNDINFANIMHADTAGTKASLAYIYWKETGDLSVWEGIAQDALVMNIDDMACVGVTDDIVISSTIGRNKHLISGDVISAVISGTMDFIDRLKKFGIRIHHAGGETADVGDIVRTIDVGITAFARIKRDELVINNIQPGNVIVGIASFGKASYENEYNSGTGSNGLTSARHDIFSKIYAHKYPESFNELIPEDVTYTGANFLTDTIEIEGQTTDIGKLVLSPTRTYMPIIKEILSAHKKNISGIIHCTGGGQTKVLHFANKVHIVKDNLFPLQPLFALIQKNSATEWKEMYRVFNMGHRIEFYTDEKTAHEIISISKQFNIAAQIVGYVEKSNSKKLTIKSNFGEFNY